jgi:hypothetical protein
MRNLPWCEEPRGVLEGTQLKIEILTPAPLGRLARASALLALVATGCPGDDTMASGSSDSGDSDDDEESAEEDESGDPTGTGTGSVTDTDTDPTEDTSDATTTGPPLEGPGCGPPPACDKGELDGSALIGSADDIELIAGYTSMTGWLEIDSTEFVCVDFLACLENVGHDVLVFGNEDLVDLSGFNALQGVGQATLDLPVGHENKDGDLSVSQNNSMQALNGFSSLEKIELTLNISNNAVMTEITGFTSLIWIVSNLNIQFNPVLTDLEGLTGLRALESECIITNNDELCTSHTQDVCGDLEVPDSSMGEFPPGNTANNKEC